MESQMDKDDKYHTATRKQLAALGYRILPNVDKVCRVTGWNSPEWVTRELASNGKGSVAERIERWPLRFPECHATGVRLENGLGAIDLDVDNFDIMASLFAFLGTLVPEVAARAPARYGGGEHKVALFVRIEGEQWNRIASRTYNGHAVEIYGGAALRGGKCSRQFGIYGPHSHNEDGTVAREYDWADGIGLRDTALGDLPVITKAQAYAIVAEFERLAQAAGWTAAAGPEVDAGDAVYDLTSDMRFDTQRSAGLTYQELCDEVEAYGDTRCSAAFMSGRGDSKSRDRCWVFWSDAHQCAGIYVYGDAQTHYPVNKTVQIAEELKTFIAAHGAGVPLPVPQWHEMYASGAPKASIENVRRALLINEVTCALDTFHNVMTITGVPFAGVVNDHTIVRLRHWLRANYGKDMTEKHIHDAVVELAVENRFDPVAGMLADAQANWDGTERLDRMAADYFNAEDTPLNRAFVRKTMIGAVRRVREPGCKHDTILVMESPEGWAKSLAWSVLAGEGNFSDVRVIGASEKEVMEQLAGIWIHENAEMAGMKKAEVEMVKAFASRQIDIARPAYGRLPVRQPRHSIEVGTTNADTYLISNTGNRRFWPVRVLAPIDIGKLRADRLQLWGEAAHWEAQGESNVLSSELWVEAAEVQEERRVEHPWEAELERLSVIPDGGPTAGIGGLGYNIVHRVGDEERVFTSDIFEKCLKLNSANMHMGHASDLSKLMKLKGWTRKLVRVGGAVRRGYVRPAAFRLKVVS
jgi:hypothetical protein